MMQGNSRADRGKMSQTQTAQAISNEAMFQTGGLKMMNAKQPQVPNLAELLNTQNMNLGMMMADKRAHT